MDIDIDAAVTALVAAKRNFKPTLAATVINAIDNRSVKGLEGAAGCILVADANMSAVDLLKLLTVKVSNERQGVA
ncbi:hypothetical protein [Pseudoalteromonas prydzensis]|uniref:hypothetical protein n=1 Tax=Pseudoalteromonas prydzensis TaxID=182141 RepID=UPI003FD553D1